MPGVASSPAMANSPGRLYQPFTSGARSAVAEVTWGAVASYFRPNPNGLLLLPALSVQVPGCDALALSGAEYVAVVQDSTPDVASLPVNATETGWLYQPLTSGP